ncbi:MAG: hypothetical protein R6X16_07445 [Anaerolineae bacterium]
MLRSTHAIRSLITPLILMLILGILVAGAADAPRALAQGAGAQAPFGGVPDPESPEMAPGDEPRTEVICEEEALALAAADYKCMFVPATAFVPTDDDMAYEYSTGCVYRTGGYYYADYSLQLPQGAVITYLRLYFMDNDATQDVSGYLYQCPGTGSCTTHFWADSDGVPGYSSAGVAVDHVVDNSSEALLLRLYYEGDDSSLRICGVRVQYKYDPFSALFLPTVTK